jgi:hypothetical protein
MKESDARVRPLLSSLAHPSSKGEHLIFLRISLNFLRQRVVILSKFVSVTGEYAKEKQ